MKLLPHDILPNGTVCTLNLQEGLFRGVVTGMAAANSFNQANVHCFLITHEWTWAEVEDVRVSAWSWRELKIPRIDKPNYTAVEIVQLPGGATGTTP